MKINIVGGLGLMGRIHTPIFESAGHEVVISSGRKLTKSLEKSVKESDLTIISVPIRNTEGVIKRIAPYANALMDFTSVKSYPTAWMSKYSGEKCEVAGLHPLYGNISSTKEKTIIYCDTKRSGEKCEEVIESLEKSGIKLVKMGALDHDYDMAFVQNARAILFETYGLLIGKMRKNINFIEEISPPPGKLLLSLIARQANKENDEMYKDMRKYNPWQEIVEREMMDCFIETLRNKDHQKKIRKLYGNALAKFQKEAQKHIDNA